MAKRTLLSMTQNILSSMSSDLVSSISDTGESVQVADFVRETYEEQMAARDWPHLRKLAKLVGLGDTSFPTRMKLPTNADYADIIKYDKRAVETDPAGFEDVIYKSPDDFLDMMNGKRSDTTEVTAYTDPDTGIVFNITTNNAPSYWTSFDDVYIIFDSFNSAIDNTLTSDKTSCYIQFDPAWEHVDEFIPDLPAKMFPMLLAEAKEVSMLNLKQVANQKEASRGRRQKNTMQHRSPRQNNKPGWNAYGRK